MTTDITIWPYTERARARNFSKPISLKFSNIFGEIGEYKLSLCEYKLSLCFLSPLLGGRKFITFLGKSNFDFPKKVMLFGKMLFFSPVSVPLSKCSTVGQVGRGFDYPWSTVAR